MKVKLFESDEKVGALYPTGSVQQRKQLQVPERWNTYLKIGAGWAWAGQSSAKLFPASRLNVNELESDEKVGAFDPTGSGQNAKRLT